MTVRRILLAFSLPIGLCAASPWSEGMGAQLRLLSGARDGQAHWAGIEIALERGWKTYWRMPGDSGIPPRIDAAASRNVASVEILWPAPVRIKDGAGASIGYEGSVVLPLRVVPVDPKAPVILDLTVEYGVCKDLCVPAQGRGSLVLFAAGADAAAIAAARARVPQEVAGLAPEGGFGVVAARLGPDVLELEVSAGGSDPAALDLFVEGPPGTAFSPPERSAIEGGRAHFRLRLDGVPEDRRQDFVFTVAAPARAVTQSWRAPAGAAK